MVRSAHHLHAAAVTCFLLVGVQLAFELPARAFVAVLEGTQQFIVYQSIELGRTVFLNVLYVVVLLAGWGIRGLAGALATTSLLTLATYWVLADRSVSGSRASPFRARRAELGRLARFGGGVFTLRLVSTVYNQMDKAIIGVALGPAAVGLYEIANRVNQSAATIGSVSVSAIVPAAAALRRQAAMLRDMFLRGSCYATAVSLPFAVAAFVFAKPLLVSWIGPSAEPAVEATRLFLAYEALQVVQNVGSTMLYGIGRIRVPIAVNVAATILNLGLSIAFVGPFGFSGVIIGTLVANGLAWPLLLANYLRVFECDLRTWFRRLVGPNLPGLLVQIAVSVGLYQGLGHTRSVPLAVALFAVSVVVSLVVFRDPRAPRGGPARARAHGAAGLGGQYERGRCMSDNLVRDVHDAVAGASNLAEASVRPPGTTDRELAAMERDVLAKLKLQPAMSVLEIGCGIGLLGVPIAGRVTRYVGVDFAPRAVEVANQRLREASKLAERALVRTLDLLSADDGEIESLGRHDRVLMYGVFHYARSEDEALQFLRSTLDLLAPGGRALIGNIPLEEDLRTAWTPAPRSAQGVLGARVAAAHSAVSS